MLFASRISGEARAAGTAVALIRDPAALAGVAGSRLLVDLNLAGAIEAARLWAAAQAGREVVGFVSHVDAQTAAAARLAGIQKVVARSQFIQALPSLLAGG